MGTIYESDEEVRELIIDAFDKNTGRGDFLRTVLGAGAGVAASGLGLGLLTGQADAAALGLDTTRTARGGFKSDIEILNYALALEHIEATFYRNVKPADAGGAMSQVYRYVRTIAAHEKAHVDALTAAITQLGGRPAKEGKYKFPKISLAFGTTVENLGVHAYLGAAQYFKSTKLLLTAASIVTVEARHASAWATLNYPHTKSADFTLGAFDSGLPKDAVLKAVSPFMVM